MPQALLEVLPQANFQVCNLLKKARHHLHILKEYTAQQVMQTQPAHWVPQTLLEVLPQVSFQMCDLSNMQ